MKEKKLGSTVVRLLQGDITTCDVDAIVSPVLFAEGEDANATQMPEPGEHDVTLIETPYLKARFVLHTGTVETTATAGAGKIRRLIKSVLAEAQQQELETLAIPPLGAGLGRFPIEKCAEILLSELQRSVQMENNHLRKVIFVFDNQKSYKTFEQVLAHF